MKKIIIIILAVLLLLGVVSSLLYESPGEDIKKPDVTTENVCSHVFQTYDILNPLAHDLICEYCSEYKGEASEHTFVNGRCSVCGYIETCKHANIHSVMFDEYHTYLCDDCGGSYSESHTVVDGYCIECGFCDHCIINYYLYVDEEGHQAYCEICQSRFYQKHITSTEFCPCSPHEHMENAYYSTCFTHTYLCDCGYIFENSESDHDFDSDGICLECSINQEKLDHDYENGVCKICNYVQGTYVAP